MLPQGGNVVGGTAQISAASDGSSLTVNQSSNRAILNWQSFSVGKGGAVFFNNGSGATLNRVTGNVPSVIDGQLSATGSLYLVNPAGVAVGTNGRIATGGTFLASTLDLLNADFLSGGDLRFGGNSTASVVNAGIISSAQGDVALMARQVRNDGTITAPNGTAELAAGYQVLMGDASGGNTDFSVEVGGADTSAVNAGTVRAAIAELQANGGNVYALAGNLGSVIQASTVDQVGGRIFLTAGSNGTVTISGDLDASGKTGSGGAIVATGGTVDVTAGALLDASGTTGGTVLLGGNLHGGADATQNFLGESVANANTLNVDAGATIRADGTAGSGGNVVLWSNDHTNFAGTISATGAGSGNGGFAEVSGKQTLAYDGTTDLRSQNGTTGTLLLDPYNVTISSGADATSSGFTATGDDSVINTTTLQNALSTANVTVSTGSGGTQAGDITVAAPVSWSANTLTLSAADSIIVNAAMTATNSAGLALQYNQGGGTTGTYTVNAPISLASTSSFSTQNGSASPVSYTIIDDGAALQNINSALTNNYVLGADIDATGTTGFTPIGSSYANSFQGIFDGLGHTISNLTISGGDYTGLFGFTANATLQNLTLTNETLTGNDCTGGLVGYAYNSTLQNLAVTNGAVTGHNPVGGVVGYMDGGTITSVASSATVTGLDGSGSVGGLVGYLAGSISDSHAAGAVAATGSSSLGNIGGLVGSFMSGSITNSYATGDVTAAMDGVTYIGGLVGYQQYGTNYPITSSYATGNVSSGANTSNIGGLVGGSYSTVSSSYASGMVSPGSGSYYIGGLIGYDDGNVSSSYATGTVTGGAGSHQIGGLVGGLVLGYNISDSYATGAVGASGSYSVGGLVGEQNGDLTNVYATGYVAAAAASSLVGGLVGHYVSGTNTNAYWDTETTGMSWAGGASGTVTSGTALSGATGVTTAELESGLPSGFSSSVWGIIPGVSYPYLSWRFPNGPSVVSGTLPTTITGGTSALGVGIAIDGTQQSQLYSGADGTYYAMVDPQSAGTADVIWLDGTRFLGSNITERGSVVSEMTASAAGYTQGMTTGQDIRLGYTSYTGTATSLTNLATIFDAAKGSLTDPAILYTVPGGHITPNADYGIWLDLTGSSFTVNDNLATTGDGKIVIESANDLSIASGNAISSQSTDDAVRLSSGGVFTNNAGSGAVTAPNGRWLIYLLSPDSGHTYGDLDSGNTAVWNTAAMSTVADSGNRYVFAYQPTLSIVALDRTKTYGDTLTIGQVDGVDYSVDGLRTAVAGAYLGDSLASVMTGIPTLSSAGEDATAAVGSYPISVDSSAIIVAKGYLLGSPAAGTLTVEASAAKQPTTDIEFPILHPGEKDAVLQLMLARGFGLDAGPLSGGRWQVFCQPGMPRSPDDEVVKIKDREWTRDEICRMQPAQIHRLLSEVQE